MANFSHLSGQRMEHGLASAVSHGTPSFLFCHGVAAADSSSLETSSGVLDTSPRGTASEDKKIRRTREDCASLSSAQSKDSNSKESTKKIRRTREDCASLSSAQSKDSNSKESTKKKGGKRERTSKEVDEEEPKGYIHVRARRGQATDSHSLAERVRRERISERMRVLQALVPGCDKVTGKALVLDEIINYVQSLQNQVEFLSMRIASLSPVLYGFGMDSDAFSDHTQKMEGIMLHHEALAMPTSVMNRAPASQAIMDTNTSSPSYELHGDGSGANITFPQDSGSYMVQEPRQELFNQVAFSNHMCSFQ